MFTHAAHHLSSEQLRFLQRGPAYVSPGQLHRAPTGSLDQLVSKQMAPLRRQLTKLFTVFPVDISRQMNFDRSIHEHMLQAFANPLPSFVHKRACQEKQLLQSLHTRLLADQLLLQRTADDYNTYWLGSRHDLKRLADAHARDGRRYELLEALPVGGARSEQQQLAEIVKSIDFALTTLHANKLLTDKQLDRLRPSTKCTFELPHMFFLPELDQVSF